MFFLVFSGYSATDRHRSISAPERPDQVGITRTLGAARPCVGLNGRLPTPPAAVLQGWRCLILAAALAASVFVGLSSRPAQAAEPPLGDRIAEQLCYPDATEELELSAQDASEYASSFAMTGAYRDIQGAEGRADFTKNGPVAECRSYASPTQELFYCAKVSMRGNILTKGRARLCF
jgi:hypothetical protein